MTQTAGKRGYVQRTAAMTPEQREAMRAVLAGEHQKATVVIPAAHFRAGLKLRLVTNGLQGAEINDDGDAV